MNTKIDMADKIFGEITVLHESGKTKNSQSCSRYCKERSIEANTTHGLSYNPLYQVWTDMKVRCRNHKKYPIYTKNKITVCQEWKNNFQAFYDFAIANGWRKDLIIDRKNNMDDYYPGNVRFVTPTISSQNTCCSKKWFINGKQYNSSCEAAKHENVSHETICNWCNGYKSRGKYYPPKAECYSKKLY